MLQPARLVHTPRRLVTPRTISITAGASTIPDASDTIFIQGARTTSAPIHARLDNCPSTPSIAKYGAGLCV